MAARVETVLAGRSLSSSGGSIGFCGTYLVTAQVSVPAVDGRADLAGTDGDFRILVDPGHVGRRQLLARALNERDIDPAGIDCVVVSHAHWDHAQNLDMFPRARVLVHAAELAAVRDGSGCDHVTPAWMHAVFEFLEVDAVVDGQEIVPGVTVIHLPGHTAGSIGLRVVTDAGIAVLTGDAVSRRGSAVAGRPAVAAFDAVAGERSVAQALAAADSIWPGHDRPFAVSGGAVGEYLEPRTVLTLTDHSGPEADAVTF